MNNHNQNQKNFQQVKKNPAAVDVISMKIDRCLLKQQDTTIQEMSENGYTHYKTIDINSGEIALRFRRAKQ